MRRRARNSPPRLAAHCRWVSLSTEMLCTALEGVAVFMIVALPRYDSHWRCLDPGASFILSIFSSVSRSSGLPSCSLPSQGLEGPTKRPMTPCRGYDEWHNGLRPTALEGPAFAEGAAGVTASNARSTPALESLRLRMVRAGHARKLTALKKPAVASTPALTPRPQRLQWAWTWSRPCSSNAMDSAGRGITLELTGTQWQGAARRMLPRTACGALPLRVRVERPVRPQGHDNTLPPAE